MAFTIKQNDTKPDFVVALRDDIGEPGEAPIDLTTATDVVFNMRIEGGAVTISRAAVTVSDAANGEVTYEWDPADTDTVGTYEAEVEIEWPGGGVETVPNDGYFEIKVTDDIA